MIHEYKKQIRYWFAVKFGSLETAYNENICEIICPDCEMKTAIDVTETEKQSCYFCGGDLISTPEPTVDTDSTVTKQAESQGSPTAHTNESSDQLVTAQ